MTSVLISVLMAVRGVVRARAALLKDAEIRILGGHIAWTLSIGRVRRIGPFRRTPRARVVVLRVGALAVARKIAGLLATPASCVRRPRRSDRRRAQRLRRQASLV
jgi:hypothetical protein